jgi:hypothetical protein
LNHRQNTRSISSGPSESQICCSLVEFQRDVTFGDGIPVMAAFYHLAPSFSAWAK